MLKSAPEPIDVQDLQFKLKCRLKIFNDSAPSTFLSQNCNLLACASRYGLIFAGTTTATFQIIQLKSIEDSSKSDGDKTTYPRRNIQLPSPPKYMYTNCEHTILAVVVEKANCPWVLFYDVKTFLSNQIGSLGEIRLSATPNVTIVDVNWNPTLSQIFTACKSDGSLGVYELKQTGIDINELPAQAAATCFSWSPKGKQIAVGSRDGKITQYKPDLKAVKIINSPAMKEPNQLISLEWISNYQFIGVYHPQTANGFASVIVVDAPKTGDVTFTNYEDICYSNGTVRTNQFYTISLPTWNILLVASSNSMEVGVLGSEQDKWTQWIMGDAARAELPLSADRLETLPIGFALDIGSVKSLIWGESTLPPSPYLLMLSHTGILCCFNVVNLKENIPTVCSPPENLSDMSGLKEFVIEQVKEAPKIGHKPENQPPPMQKPTHFAAPSLFNAKEVSVAPKPTLLNIPTPGVKDSPVLPSPIKQVEEVKTPEPPKSAGLPEIEEEKLFGQMIKEELIYFESELKAVLHDSKSVVISGREKTDSILTRTKNLVDFFEQVVDNCNTQKSDVCCLLQNVLQSWAWYEEAKSKYAASQDESMSLILRSEPLDSASAKRLADMQHINYYIESQLAQANRVLDEQWDNFQDYCKKTYKIQIPTMEAIFQTLVKNQAIVQKQNYIIKDIARRLKKHHNRSSLPLLSRSTRDDTKVLEKSLKSLNLVENDKEEAKNAMYEFVQNKTKNLTHEKRKALKTFLTKQKAKDVTVTKTTLSSSMVMQLSPSKWLNSKNQMSLLGAKMSPVSKVTATPVRRLDFIQSTPKTSQSDIVAAEKLGGGGGAIESLQNFAMKFEPAKNLGSTATAGVGLIKSAPNSAFVSTSFGTMSAATGANKGGLLPSFGNASPMPSGNLFGYQQKSAATSTPSSIFAQPAPTINKPLVATTAPTMAAPNAFSFASPVSVVQPTPSSAVKPSAASSTTGFAFGGTSLASSSANLIKTPPTTAFSSGVGLKTTKIESSTPSTSSIFSFSSTPAAAATTSSIFGSKSTATVAGTTSAVSSSTTKPFSFGALAGNSAISITPIPKATLPQPQQQQQPVSLVTSSKSDKENVVSTAVTTASSAGSIFDSLSAASTSSSKSIFANVASGIGVSSSNSPKTPSTAAPSIFGNAASSPSLFSNIESTAATPTSSVASPSATIFGSGGSTSTIVAASTAATPSSASSIFASAAQKTIFGTGGTSSSTSIFGAVSSAPATTSQITTTTTQSIFSSQPATVSTSLVTSSVTPQQQSSSIFGAPTTSAPVTQTSLFGAPALTSTPSSTTSFFGAASPPPSSAPSVFGAPTTGTAATGASSTQSVFGPSATISDSAAKPLFGAFAPATTAPSVFGTAATATTQSGGSIFGGSASSSPQTQTNTSIFGQNAAAAAAIPASTSQSVFGGFQSKPASIFGGTSSAGVSGPSAQTGSIFGSNTSTATSPFSSTANNNSATVPQDGSSVFGGGGAAPVFGQSPSFGATPTSGVFGQAASPFGSGNTTAAPNNNTSSASIFGSPAATSSANVFGAAANSTQAASPFGNAATSQSGQAFGGVASGTSFGFGGLNVGGSSGAATSTFGSAGSTTPQVSNPFGAKPSTFGAAAGGDSGKSIFGGGGSNAPTFGYSSGSIFGGGAATSASTFGSAATSGSTFGSPVSNSGSIFGQSSVFGQSAAGGSGSNASSTFGSSAFGGGPFSGGSGGSVAQSGFGAATFQKSPGSAGGFGGAPVFGSSGGAAGATAAPSAFGSPPSFGGSPSFGAAPAFGSPQKVFGSTPGGGTFGAAAVPPQGAPVPQNTGFGSLANQNTVGFGNLAQQASAPPVSNSGFSGGSSFSSWR